MLQNDGAKFILCWISPPKPDGKTDKHAVNPHDCKQPHDPHDPAIWLEHAAALAMAQAMGPSYAVGYVITPEARRWCLDIDGCLEPGGWSAESMRLCGMLPGAMVEVSQSGRGLHVWGRWPDAWATEPDHRVKPNDRYDGGAHLEFYTSGRFIVLGSGAVGDPDAQPDLSGLMPWFEHRAGVSAAGEWTDGPVPEWGGTADDAELLAKAMASASAAGAWSGKATFSDLWTANREALGRNWPDPVRDYDASMVDAALASHLAFWTGKDCARIERLMRQSALYRDKWDKHRTYMRDTIIGAVAHCSGVYGARAVAAAADGLSFTEAAGGALRSNLASVYDMLRSPSAGVTLAHDRFLDRVVIRRGDHSRPLQDTDYGYLRAEFERRGFKPISKDVMRDAILMVANDNQFDSAIEWGNGLVWDGVQRVRGSMTRYWGVAPSPYAEAAGEYLWTALAGRCMDPGCQADMALILVGVQGDRKTSAVSAIAPTPEAFTGVSLERRDEDLSRKLRGKLVIELAEMRGMTRGRDMEGVKDWISRRWEEWTPKYQEFGTRFARRCICLGTANDTELLDDPTGERRWLPMVAAVCDVASLERDRDQLWAEGLAMWRQGGIRWQAAEELARAEHGKFKVHDEYIEAIRDWLDRPEPMSGKVPADGPIKLQDVARGALGIAPDRLSMGEQMRIGKCLRALNYVKKDVLVDGKGLKRWIIAGNRP